MFLSVNGDRLVGRIFVSDHPSTDGYFNAYCSTEGEDVETAFIGLRRLLDFLSAGRATFLREGPLSVEEMDFDTKRVRHRAFVRFSFALRNGISQRIPVDEFCGFGLSGYVDDNSTER